MVHYTRCYWFSIQRVNGSVYKVLMVQYTNERGFEKRVLRTFQQLLHNRHFKTPKMKKNTCFYITTNMFLSLDVINVANVSNYI